MVLFFFVIVAVAAAATIILFATYVYMPLDRYINIGECVCVCVSHHFLSFYAYAFALHVLSAQSVHIVHCECNAASGAAAMGNNFRLRRSCVDIE